MIESTNQKVQEFLEHTRLQDYNKYELVQAVRQKVFTSYPQAEERIQYGGILFKLDEDVSGVFVYQNHVSMEFSYGFKFNDPDGLLEGGGKYRRHLKLRALEDMEIKRVDYFVKQIKE